MRTDWRLVGLLFAAGLLASGQFAKIALTMPALDALYPGREAVIPFAVSALSVMGILFGATAGVIVARFGVRRVLLAGLIGGAALSLAQAVLPPFPVLILLRLAEGAAHLAIVVAAPTLMAEVSSDRDRAVVMGLWGTFFGVGFAIAAALFPPLLVRYGAGGVFAAHAAALAALALVLAPLLPRGVAVAGDGAGWLARHRRIYGTPAILAPALGFFWHTLMFLALLTFLPRFTGDWTGPALPLVALVGTFAGGSLAGRLGPRRVLVAGFALTILAALLLAAAPDALRAPAAFVLILMAGVVPGASFAAVPALNPTAGARALANGAVAQLGNLGTFLSTPLFALMLVEGLAGLMGLVALISAFGIGAVLLIHRKLSETP